MSYQIEMERNQLADALIMADSRVFLGQEAISDARIAHQKAMVLAREIIAVREKE